MNPRQLNDSDLIDDVVSEFDYSQPIRDEDIPFISPVENEANDNQP